MTSEPSPREVVVKLLMKSSNEKSRRNFNSSRWRWRGRFGLLRYYDGGGGVVLPYSVITTMAAEGSFWPTLLFLRRWRGRFGLLYSSHGDSGECTVKVVLLIYYHEKARNLTTSEPSPREVVCRVADGEAKLYKKRFKTRETRTSRSLQGARRKFPIVTMVKEGMREMEISTRCSARDKNARFL